MAKFFYDTIFTLVRRYLFGAYLAGGQILQELLQAAAALRCIINTAKKSGIVKENQYPFGSCNYELQAMITPEMQANDMFFKGETSLSKAWNLTERFSEDISYKSDVFVVDMSSYTITIHHQRFISFFCRF